VDAPELILPLRLDDGKALEQLRNLSVAGTAATDQVMHGIQTAPGATRNLAKETTRTAGTAANLGTEIGGLVKAQLTLAAVKQVASAFADSMNQAAERAAQMSKDFVQLQKSMQGIACLAEEKHIDKFTLEEAQKAGAANATPEEFVGLRKSFLAKASLYIGEGPSSKLSAADAEEVQRTAAQYASQKGISQQEMGGFIGGLLAQEKGPTTAEAFKKKIGAVFSALEASSTKVVQLLPDIMRVEAAALSAEQSASLLAQMPEIGPGEESTYVLRAVEELREKRNKGEGEKFGLIQGQHAYQMIQAVVKNLEERQAKDEDLEKLLIELTPDRISRRAIRGLLEQGGTKGLERWKGLVENAPADALDKTIEEGRHTNAGRHRAREVWHQLPESERGAYQAPAQDIVKEAKTRLIKEGWLQTAEPVGDLLRGATQIVMQVTPEQQKINAEALREVNKKARAAVLPATLMAPRIEGGGTYARLESETCGATQNQAEINEEILRVLRETQKYNQQMVELQAESVKAQKEPKQAARSLEAPMPMKQPVR
jgi:hypothetical protein